jgi:hypothetical protein
MTAVTSSAATATRILEFEQGVLRIESPGVQSMNLVSSN